MLWSDFYECCTNLKPFLCRKFLGTLARCQKLLMCGLHGDVAGLGVTMLPLFDVVVASDSATFSAPYAQLGCVPEGVSLLHAHRSVSKALVRRNTARKFKFNPTILGQRVVVLVQETAGFRGSTNRFGHQSAVPHKVRRGASGGCQANFQAIATGALIYCQLKVKSVFCANTFYDDCTWKK